jgi:phosphoribosylamine--glycine ligase
VAAAGYPESPRKGDVITLPAAQDDVILFHAGTARSPSGELVTAGGRVLAVTGLGADIASAREASVGAAAEVRFAGKHYRSDIGWREMTRDAGAARN